MENVWGMWFFFYVPAFLCGCAVGGAVMLALARKAISKASRRGLQPNRPANERPRFAASALRKAC